MTYVPDHRKASKLEARLRSLKKLFKGPKGRRKHEENTQIERENRERSSEEKRLQEILEAEINRKRAQLKGLPAGQSLRSADAKGKRIATDNLTQNSITSLPGSPQPSESLISPRPLNIEPVSSFSTLNQPAQRPAPLPPQLLVSRAMESLETTRSEPSILPSQQQDRLDPEARHSESGPSTTKAPSRERTLEIIGTISSTEAAEAFLRSNNPYHNGTYRTYLLNKQGAGSAFIREMEISAPQYGLG